MIQKTKIQLPAEWQTQSGVMLTWPHEETDWKDNLEEITDCYVNVAREILKREKLLIVCREKKKVEKALGLKKEEKEKVIFRELPSNDTWSRDIGPISILVDGKPYLYDFGFNGWGLKYAANFDNQMTKELYRSKAFKEGVGYQSMLHCILEGGSVESDGKGTLMTTTHCLLSKNRNEYKTQYEIADYLQMIFQCERVLWIHHGRLTGDDTDGHIDTLARFCDENTIAYVKCDEPSDPDYEELSIMEKEISFLKTKEDKPYRLIPLPMADKIVWKGERLPATYANFLILNGAVLLPFYESPKDETAKKFLQEAFPDREIVGIDCRPIIKQRGSLHCISMQFPENFI